jgi:hypothetical protein
LSTGRKIRTPTHNARISYHKFSWIARAFFNKNDGRAGERMERLNMEGGGTLTLDQNGPKVRFEAERAEDNAGLYKVWLRGSHGGKCVLGTLAPEGNCLRLCRTLSVGELERSGCWPVEQAEAALAFSFSGCWYCEQHPEQWLSDTALREHLRGPMLCRKENNLVCLASPFRTDRPIVLPELFCLAHLEQVEGQTCLVWTFDHQGRPIICDFFGNNL